MSKNLSGEGMVKARNISTMRGCKEKVEFYAADKKIASYPKINKNDNIFDVNRIVKFREK